MKKRYRLDLSFDGTGFSGWQRQDQQLSVQETIEAVLEKMTREKISLRGASRTDAGVHARQFVAHFDASTEIPLQRLYSGLNALLPAGICVLQIKIVPDSFNARKDALLKTYRYHIFNCPGRDPFYERRAWHISSELDLQGMAQAAALIQGRHDFSCFQGADFKPRPSLRDLKHCGVKAFALTERPHAAPHAREIRIELQSKGFLKYMVRNIVGTLVEVGQHKRTLGSISALLESKDRRQAGPTAPPHGLYLCEIKYA